MHRIATTCVIYVLTVFAYAQITTLIISFQERRKEKKTLVFWILTRILRSVQINENGVVPLLRWERRLRIACRFYLRLSLLLSLLLLEQHYSFSIISLLISYVRYVRQTASRTFAWTLFASLLLKNTAIDDIAVKAKCGQSMVCCVYIRDCLFYLWS